MRIYSIGENNRCKTAKTNKTSVPVRVLKCDKVEFRERYYE